jgi:hypothetical protein
MVVDSGRLSPHPSLLSTDGACSRFGAQRPERLNDLELGGGTFYDAFGAGTT